MSEYHDKEWGRLTRDSRGLWETLMLEGFQAGLSWQIVLHKRDEFRKAFHQFDPKKVARMTDRDVERLMQNPGIIRARAKIEATIKGAKLFVEMEKNGEAFGISPGAFVTALRKKVIDSRRNPVSSRTSWYDICWPSTVT